MAVTEGVTVRAFEVTGRGRLASVDPARVLDADARGSASYWVDLTSPSRDDLHHWVQALGAPDLLAGLVTDPPASAMGESSSGAAVLDDGAYFYFPLYGSDDFASAESFHGLCVPSVLLTYHARPLPNLEAALELAQRGDLLPAPNVPGLVSALTRYAARRCADATKRLRNRLNALGQRIAQSDDASDVDPGELLACDEMLQALDAAVDEQLASLRVLLRARSTALDMAPLADHMSVALGNLETLGRSVDRLERRGTTIRSQYDSLLAERSNRRISALTILTAVFMPATLIAGIYGMNFDHMPALHMHYGYQIALLAMGSIAAGGLWLFWKGGWFR